MFSCRLRLPSMPDGKHTLSYREPPRGAWRAALAAGGLAGVLALTVGSAARAAPTQTVDGLNFAFAAVRSDWINTTGHPCDDVRGSRC
jgi:hypothetical protein